MSLRAGNGRKLYLAYGSNLHKVSMRVRCPSARAVGTFFITQARLVFRSVADIAYSPDAQVPVGVWSITREDEVALDRYEGVRINMYRRETLRVGDEDALIYMMNDRGIGPPGVAYLDTIRRGYDDFGLDHAYLDAALHASYDEKLMTDQIAQRRERSTRHGKIAPKIKATVKTKTTIVKAKPRKGIPQEQRRNIAIGTSVRTLEQVADEVYGRPYGDSRLIKKGEQHG